MSLQDTALKIQQNIADKATATPDPTKVQADHLAEILSDHNDALQATTGSTEESRAALASATLDYSVKFQHRSTTGTLNITSITNAKRDAKGVMVRVDAGTVITFAAGLNVEILTAQDTTKASWLMLQCIDKTAPAYVASFAAIGAAAAQPPATVTPAAPTFTGFDDTANTVTLVPASGVPMADYRYTLTGNATVYTVDPSGVISVGNIATTVSAYSIADGNRNQSPNATQTFTLAGNTTPAAPTIAADDTANTLSASHALGDSEILESENNGAYVAYTGAKTIGDVALAQGYWKFKIKAATGRNESAVAESPAFTVAGGGGTPPEATTYFTAVEATGASLTQTQKDAYSAFVDREKAAGRYTKYLGIFPIMGATQAAHAINAKTPGTGDLTFSGNWSHTDQGMKITDAPMSASMALTTTPAGQNSNLVGVYINEDLGTNGYDFGGVCGGVGGYTDMGRFGSTQYFHNAATPDHSVAVVNDITGLQLITRTLSTEFHHVGRGTSTTFSQASGTDNIAPQIAIGNIAGLPSNSSQRRYAFGIIGEGLTVAEAQGLTTSLNTLQTDLSRA